MRDLVARADGARRRRLGRAGRPPADLRRAQRARAPGRGRAARARRRSGRPGRGALGEQHRVGRDVLGLRGDRRRVRAAQRVVEGRGARVRARATPARKVLFCDPKRWAVVRDVVADARPTSSTSSSPTSTRPTARPARRPSCSTPTDPGALPDVAVARGRPARDPLHLGHDREAEGRDDHAPPGAREPAEPRVPRARSRPRRARRRPTRRTSRPRTCSSCRCST